MCVYVYVKISKQWWGALFYESMKSPILRPVHVVTVEYWIFLKVLLWAFIVKLIRAYRVL